MSKILTVHSSYPMVTDWIRLMVDKLGWEVSDGEDGADHDSVTLIDISRSKDVDLVAQADRLEKKIVLFSRLPEERLISLLYDYEILGFVHCSMSLETLKTTLESAARGEEYFDERILTFILSAKYRDIHDRISSLSGRELQIIDGIIDDLTNDELAHKFNLSVRTVNAHKRNILQKMKERSLVGVLRTILTYSMRYI